MNIIEALKSLDPANNDHWTADGLPRVDVVAQVTGDETVTRKAITDALPNFTRSGLAPTDGQPGLSALGTGVGDAPSADVDAAPAVADQPQAEASDGAQPAPAQVEMDGPAVDPRILQLQAQLADVEAEMYEAQREFTAAKQRADAAANKVDNLNRAIERLQRSDPTYQSRLIRSYLDQQNANRVARAQGLQKFVDGTGAHPADIAKLFDPRAQIDRSLNNRRNSRGYARPQYPAN